MGTMKATISKGIGDAVIRFRIPILVLSFLLTIVFCYGITKIDFRVKLEDMLPPTSPFVKLDQKFGEMFGSYDFFSVQLSVKTGEIFEYDNLTALKSLTDDIYFLPDVKRSLVWSLSLNKVKEIRGSGGNLYVNAFMWPHVPKTKDGLDKLKRAVLTSDIYAGKLISTDNKAALITGYVKKDHDSNRFFQSLLELRNKYQKENPNIEIKMIGRPVLMGWIYHHFPEMFVIFGVTIVMIMAVLSISFRSLQGLAVPLFVGVLSSVWGLGIIGLLGINLNPLMVVLPFLIGSRSLSHAVQITSRYLEEYSRSKDERQATYITVEHMFLANASAIASDIAGFMTLTLASILLIQDIGISMTLWMLGVFFTTAILTPLICMSLPPISEKRMEQLRKIGSRDGDIIDRLLIAITRFSITKQMRLPIVLGMVIIIAAGLKLASMAQFGDLSPGSPILWPDSEYNVSSEEINKRFEKAGSDKFQLFIEGVKEKSILSNEALTLQVRLDNFYRDTFPGKYAGADTVDSIIKTLNTELHEGDVAWAAIPSSPAMIGTCLGFYLNKLNAHDFDSYADAKLKHANLTFYFKDHMPDTVNAVVDKTKAFLEKQALACKMLCKPTAAVDTTQGAVMKLDFLPDAEIKMCGGNIGIEYAKNHELERVHYHIIFGVLLLIFILCISTFRSIVAGIFLIIPLIASNAIALSYMYLKGIGTSINTLPVITVGLGVGIDFGIYLYSRYQEEYKSCKELDKAVAVGNATAGKGVLFTAITLILPVSLWYFMSGIKFQGEMGLFLAILLTVNLISCLIFHPAITTLIKPKFIIKPRDAEAT